jgi:5'-nucleotidase
LKKLSPCHNPVILLEGTGAQILKILENGVSKVPGLEGRFPCVSGIRFSFDPKKEPGSRIDPSSVVVVRRGQLQHEPFDLERKYKVSTTHYLSQGNDGFDEFTKMNCLIDDDSAFDITDMIVKVFRELQVGTEFYSTPFVKIPSAQLITPHKLISQPNSFIIQSVRRQIVEAHKVLK